MKRLIFSLLIFGCTLGFSQTNWKDSTIAGKFKPLDAYELDGLVYFKTKKGWGVYWPVQSHLVIAPAYQFILCQKPDMMDVFYAVKKNKILLLSSDGKPLKNKAYDQLGEGYSDNRRYIAENGKTIFYDGDKVEWITNYTQFTDGNESSLTIKNNLVFMNVFQKAWEPSPLRVIRDGMEEDSLDAKGNVVMQEYLPKMSSAVYDLKTGLWIVPPGAAKVGSCGNNIIVKDIVKKGIHTEERISVLDKTFQKTGSFSFKDAIEDPKAIKIILSDFNPVSVEKCFDENLLWRIDFYNGRGILQMVKFETETKQGLYYPWFFEVVTKPDKYDFVFMPNAFTSEIYTLQNNKVGFYSEWGQKREYSNLYNKLYHTNTFINSIEQEISVMECNGNDAEPVEQDEKDTGQFTKPLLDQLSGFVRHASMEINGDHIIVHDFIPKEENTNYEPLTVYLPDGSSYDSVRVDESGETVAVYRQPDPGGSFGGVYSLSTKKWIIPRKFSKIIKTESGFSCVRKYKDSVLLSYYSHTGKEIFKGLTADSLIKNNDLLSKFTGVKFTGSLKVKFAPNNYYGYDGKQIVFTEAKKCGVFDIYKLTWVIKPETDLVDFNFTTSTFTIMQNGLLGLRDIFGNEIAQPLYKRFEFKITEGGFILNDSLFCNLSYPFTTVPVDSAIRSNNKHQHDERAYVADQKSEIIDKKLVVSESLEQRDYLIDPIMFGDVNDKRTWYYSRSVDPRNFETRYVKNAIAIYPWKDGFILTDSLDQCYFENKNGQRTLISTLAQNVRISKDHIYSFEINNDYIYAGSGNGNIYAYRGSFDESEMSDMSRVVGYKTTCFDGEKIIETPKEFTLLALNKSGIGIGYTVIKEPKGDNHNRKYCYYDLNTKQFSNCDLEFAPFGCVQIAEVNGYFVCMENDLKKNISNVWLLEQDLKTVKSSFLELKYFAYEHVSNPLDRIILFKITTKTKKEMYFDKDFQFILEADEGQFETKFSFWDRLLLKSPKKTVQMNLKGQIVNK